MLLPVLAEIDGWAVAQMVFNGVLSIAVAIAMYRTRKIDNLESEVKTAARDLIDQKIGQLAEKLQDSIDHLSSSIDSINKRLSEGEGEFRSVRDRDHDLEMKCVARNERIMQYIRDHTATRESQQKLFDKCEELRVLVAQGGR